MTVGTDVHSEHPTRLDYRDDGEGRAACVILVKRRRCRILGGMGGGGGTGGEDNVLIFSIASLVLYRIS
jgi:hypothetical protein